MTPTNHGLLVLLALIGLLGGAIVALAWLVSGGAPPW